jgi:hypothetical protein
MEVKTKFGTYMEDKESATKLTVDKITVFVERLKKIGIDVNLTLHIHLVMCRCGLFSRNFIRRTERKF